uniref:hypothetical protein n=1 Tax=Enterobacter hormaechei TaxID=158836 RepID=UPI001953346D
ENVDGGTGRLLARTARGEGKSDGAERRPRAEPAVFPGSETALSAALSASLSMRRESAGGEAPEASRPARGVGYGWV